MKISTKHLTLSGLFLALGLVLPFLTGQIPEIGNQLLPMHIPILLCGFVCGPICGAVVGAVTPLIRSLLFGMPPMMSAIAMAFELLGYGLMAGLFYRTLPKKPGYLYVSLLGAMIVGRIMWGVASIVIYAAMGNAFTWQIFFAGAVLNAVPGIIVQIVIIPLIVLALQRARLMEYA